MTGDHKQYAQERFTSIQLLLYYNSSLFKIIFDKKRHYSQFRYVSHSETSDQSDRC